MSINYPASLDDAVVLPNPTATIKQNNPSHSELHSNENASIVAVETKIGIGASTPAANKLLLGTGAGTSAWQQLTSAELRGVLSDETGTGSAVFATTPTLVTPKVDVINEATAGSGVTADSVELKDGSATVINATATTSLISDIVTEYTADNGVTIDGLNIKDSKLNTANAVDNTSVSAGMQVQYVYTSYSAVATGTTVIPSDDTVPQNTEGTEFMTQTITPKSATNLLIIEANLVLSHASSVFMIVALFQDTTAGALNVISNYEATGSGATMTLVLRHTMVASTTSATTFKIRAGAGSAGTTTFNGSLGNRYFGAIPKSSITITEIKA